MSETIRVSVFLAVFAAGLLSAMVAAGRPSPPTITGQLIPADGGTPGELRVFLRAGLRIDSVPVDASGRFSLPFPAPTADEPTELFVDAADRANRRYHPALVRVHPDSLAQEQHFVLVPRRWTIPTGRYAGTAVEISPHRAFEPVCRHCSAFYRREITRSAAYQRLQSWPEGVFPIRVAFDREFSGAGISARDSTAFWRAVEAMEADLGSDLFRPARYAETLPTDDGGPEDVILIRIDPALGHAGLGSIVSQRGDILYGAVRVKRAGLLSGSYGQHLVAHELMHTLGFGHTCGWRSVVADPSRCAGQHADALTPADVAHAQLLRRVRAIQLAYDARWGMEAALAGERVLTLGLPLDAPDP